MRSLAVLAAALVLVGSSTVAEAFDKCRQLAETPAAFVERSTATALARLPFKYFDQASTIKVETQPSDLLLFPVASDAQPIVAFPAIFPGVFCKIVLAEYLHVERMIRGLGGESETTATEAEFNQAAQSATQCLDSGASKRACLVAFANDLERRYEGFFKRLEPLKLQAALTLLDTALEQIAIHEYGHHVLNHFRRVKSSQLTRKDAEFEADYLAMVGGVNAGNIPSTLYYFFRPLAEVERYTQKLFTEDYESGFCVTPR